MGAHQTTHPKRESENDGREITPEELALWRKTGAWPNGVSKSADYVELTPEEIRVLGATGTWPARLG